MRCPTCNEPMHQGELDEAVTFDGVRFEGVLSALKCACGEAIIFGEALVRFDRRVAEEMTRAGVVSGERFCFLRKTIGLSATNVAALLGVALESVSRWEHGKQNVDPRAFALLCLMVRDHLAERTDARDVLRAIAEPSVRPSTVRIET